MSRTDKDASLSAGQSRRTIVKGAAWSVPVIAAAIATPMAAATGIPSGTLTVTSLNCAGLEITNHPGFTLTAVGGDTSETTFLITSSNVLSASLRDAWTTSAGLTVSLLGNNTWSFTIPALSQGQTVTLQTNTQLLNLLATFTGTVQSSGSSAKIRITNVLAGRICRTL